MESRTEAEAYVPHPSRTEQVFVSVSDCEAQQETKRFSSHREGQDIDCLILRVQPSMVESPEGQQTCGYGGVAQLGEHLPCKQGVDSSILFVSTSGEPKGKLPQTGWPMKRTGHIHGLIAQVVRAHA